MNERLKKVDTIISRYKKKIDEDIDSIINQLKKCDTKEIIIDKSKMLVYLNNMKNELPHLKSTLISYSKHDIKADTYDFYIMDDVIDYMFNDLNFICLMRFLFHTIEENDYMMTVFCDTVFINLDLINCLDMLSYKKKNEE